jgi:hypothetical protein
VIWHRPTKLHGTKTRKGINIILAALEPSSITIFQVCDRGLFIGLMMEAVGKFETSV